MIDRAKLALSSINDLIMPNRVVYHHVPKCGGTSVGRALRKRFILNQATVVPESSFRAFESFSGRHDRQQMLIDVLDLREQMMLYHMYENVHCVSLHVRFSEVAYTQFRDQYKFITILREPISRFISHYLWSYGKTDAHARIEEEFEDFLNTPRARRLGATYVEYFCGLPKECDITAQAAIKKAISNLKRMDVVGQLDNLELFERQLKQSLGVRIRIGHENKMRQPSSKKEEIMTPELVDRVRELCAPDLAVWRAIQKTSAEPPIFNKPCD
ncbi:sulfotransferase family 2 domain-containing protein [Amaricoccus tamworthensis]|uniref:sulfotransferase family 2 domain-containing protein n=1 Tax=Amaricoccus tamworthensis TaxID=57002 RepID=UPI003C7C706E